MANQDSKYGKQASYNSDFTLKKPKIWTIETMTIFQKKKISLGSTRMIESWVQNGGYPNPTIQQVAKIIFILS